MSNSSKNNSNVHLYFPFMTCNPFSVQKYKGHNIFKQTRSIHILYKVRQHIVENPQLIDAFHSMKMASEMPIPHSLRKKYFSTL